MSHKGRVPAYQRHKHSGQPEFCARTGHPYAGCGNTLPFINVSFGLRRGGFV